MRAQQITLTDRLPAYFLFDYAKLGNFALTTKDTRYILDEYAVNYEGEVNTPGHHFSKVCKDIRFPKQETYHDTLSYPYKAKPGPYPYAFYVDIRHAFSQIAAVFGVDCSHREGRYMAFGTTELPEIFNESKIMRALLVSGTGKQSTLQEWKNGSLSSRQFPNRNYAPMLSRAIFSFLHACAYSLERYCLYWHTDGCIVPYMHMDRVGHWLEERRILYSIKGEGITEIYGVGSYRIGNTRTKGRNVQQQSHSNIRDMGAKWWLEQWDRSPNRI